MAILTSVDDGPGVDPLFVAAVDSKQALGAARRTLSGALALVLAMAAVRGKIDADMVGREGGVALDHCTQSGTQRQGP